MNDGTSWLSALFTSVVPPVVSASLEMTSIGTGLSATVRPTVRVPVTTIAWSGEVSCSVVPGSSCAACWAGGSWFWAAAGAAASASDEIDVSKAAWKKVVIGQVPRMVAA